MDDSECFGQSIITIAGRLIGPKGSTLTLEFRKVVSCFPLGVLTCKRNCVKADNIMFTTWAAKRNLRAAIKTEKRALSLARKWQAATGLPGQRFESQS